MKNKIIKNIKINTKTKCWNWQMYCYPNGYGQACWKGKHKLAHRLSYEAFKGEIPSGLCVLHTCDNRKCCNPDHLWIGTHLDNARDRDQKGRLTIPDRKGEKHPRARLTKAQALEILASDKLHKIIAEKYGIARQTVSNIKAGVRWGHLRSMANG